jgi:hypothetical protein
MPEEALLAAAGTTHPEGIGWRSKWWLLVRHSFQINSPHSLKGMLARCKASIVVSSLQLLSLSTVMIDCDYLQTQTLFQWAPFRFFSHLSLPISFYGFYLSTSLPTVTENEPSPSCEADTCLIRQEISITLCKMKMWMYIQKRLPLYSNSSSRCALTQAPVEL